MEFKDYYQIMGVKRDATQDEIKRAYRKLARKYHPDVSKESDAEARFKEVGEAYEVLKDPEKRTAYDQLGANWKAGQDFRPPPDWDADGNPAGSAISSKACSVTALAPAGPAMLRITPTARTPMPRCLSIWKTPIRVPAAR